MPNRPRFCPSYLAGELAPEYARRLSVARQSCAQVLEMAASDAGEWSIIDCSTFISRSVPDAVSTAAALIKNADPTERGRIADELIASLEGVAKRAREEIENRRVQLRNNWDVIRTHIASRTSP